VRDSLRFPLGIPNTLHFVSSFATWAELPLSQPRPRPLLAVAIFFLNKLKHISLINLIPSK
jgi:hypothetical protein